MTQGRETKGEGVRAREGEGKEEEGEMQKGEGKESWRGRGGKEN